MKIKDFRDRIRKSHELQSYNVEKEYRFLNFILIMESVLAVMTFVILLIILNGSVVSLLIAIPLIIAAIYMEWPRMYFHWEQVYTGKEKELGWKHVYGGKNQEFGRTLLKFGFSVFAVVLILDLFGLFSLWYFYKMPGEIGLLIALSLLAIGSIPVIRLDRDSVKNCPECTGASNKSRILLFYYRLFAVPTAVLNGIYLITWLVFFYLLLTGKLNRK